MKLPIEPRVPPLRSSGMKILHQCRRKFLWSEIYRLRRGIKGTPLRIGTYVHHMLVSRYRGQTAQQAFESASDYLTGEREVLLKQMKDGIIKSGERFESISKQMSEDLQKAYAMLDAFLTYYPINPNREVVGTEMFFEVQLEGFSMPIQGQIDLLLRDRKTGRLTIVDLKTHGVTTAIRAATNVFDVQTHLFYTLGLQDMLEKQVDLPLSSSRVPFCDSSFHLGLRSDSDLLRGSKLSDFTHIEYFLLKKPTIKCCKKDDYDLGNYIQRVRKWYDEQTTQNPNDPPFAVSSQPIQGNPLTDPESLLKLQDHAKAASHDPMDFAWFYKTADDTMCSSRLGSCPYLDLCRTDRARGQWPVMITMTYHQEERT